MPGAEARLRQRIRKAILINHPRVLVWGMPASAFSGPGRADLFGVAYARPFNFEVKTDTGKPTKIQEIVLRECRRAGSYAWIVRTPLQAVDAIEWIRKRGRTPMPDDILDIEDWFKGLDAAEAPVAEEPLEPEELPLQEQATAEQNAFDLGNGTATIDIPIDTPVLPGADLDKAPDDMSSIEEATVKVMTELVEVVRSIKADQRTLGDRITLVWQVVNRLENNLLFTNQRIDKLIAMIMEEEAPDVTTSFQLPGEDATEMELAESPKPTRRRRNSKA